MLLSISGILYCRNRLEPSEYDTPSQMYARLHFTLLSHPTVRYRRYVVNDLLDVIGKRLTIVINSNNYLVICNKILYRCRGRIFLAQFFLQIFSLSALFLSTIKQAVLPTLTKQLGKHNHIN